MYPYHPRDSFPCKAWQTNPVHLLVPLCKAIEHNSRSEIRCKARKLWFAKQIERGPLTEFRRKALLDPITCFPQSVFFGAIAPTCNHSLIEDRTWLVLLGLPKVFSKCNHSLIEDRTWLVLLPLAISIKGTHENTTNYLLLFLKHTIEPST